MTRPKYRLDALAAAAGLSMPALSRVLNLSGTQWKQARDEGVGERAADRYAVKLGLTPIEVWPEMLDAAIEQERERRRKIARDSARRRYHADPVLRANKKAAAKAYRAASKAARQFQPHRSPEARRAANRRYYERHAERLKAEARARYAAKLAQGADGTVAA